MEETITINVPLDVPQKLVDLGLVDLYAKDKGWSPENELTAIEYLTKWVRTMVKNDFKNMYSRYAQAKAVEKAEADAKALFN